MYNKGPIPDNFDNTQLQYLMVLNEKVTISCKGHNNNCCLLKNESYILVLNIIQKNNVDIFLVGKQLKFVKNVYTLPCKSSILNIKIMTINDDKICSWPITDLLCKAWKMPYNNSKTFAIFPLNHII